MKNVKNILPDAQLELEHVHGYMSSKLRNNIKYNRDGMIVYHIASLGNNLKIHLNCISVLILKI